MLLRTVTLVIILLEDLKVRALLLLQLIRHILWGHSNSLRQGLGRKGRQP